MKTITNTLRNVLCALRFPWQLLRYAGLFFWAVLSPKAVLAVRLLAVESQLAHHTARSHQGIGGQTPIRQKKPPNISGPSKLVSIPVLGGLHHRYVRVAA